MKLTTNFSLRDIQQVRAELWEIHGAVEAFLLCFFLLAFLRCPTGASSPLRPSGFLEICLLLFLVVCSYLHVKVYWYDLEVQQGLEAAGFSWGRALTRPGEGFCSSPWAFSDYDLGWAAG